MSDIRKRMAHVRAALHQPALHLKSDRRRMEELYNEHGLDIRRLHEFFKIKGTGVTGEHNDALRRAKEYFGVDDDHHAALAMAMVLFGPRERGRAKGTKTWTYQKYLHLAEACSELWEKDDTLSDTEICNRLGKGGDPKSDFRDYDPDHLRTLLPKARRAALNYLADLAADEAKARRKGEL
jgi:hypothetical protein